MYIFIYTIQNIATFNILIYMDDQCNKYEKSQILKERTLKETGMTEKQYEAQRKNFEQNNSC